jgi:predicted aconitase
MPYINLMNIEVYKNTCSFSIIAVNPMHAVATTTITNPIKAAFFLPSLSNNEPTIGEKINAETSKAL